MIQLSSTLYEKNFRKVLHEDNWFLQYESKYISRKVYIVNNIYPASRQELEQLKAKFNDQVVFVESTDIHRQSLRKFNSKMKQYELAWWFSIQYFCQMYFALEQNIEFVLNVGADCTVYGDQLDEFISDSIEVIRTDPSVLLTSIAWQPGDFSQAGNNEQTYHDIQKRHEKFWMSKVVSDQFFFCSPAKCLQVDFNVRKLLHPFPRYGGHSFEKNFTNFLIKNGFFRAIHKSKNYYIHQSFR